MNPLARYLKKHNLQQKDFAQALSAISGFRIHASVVSMWCGGKWFRRPERMNRRLIAAATNQEVKAEAWDDT